MRRLLDAVLFDLDGVLTSTTALHIDCWKRTFDPLLAELGQAPFDAHREYADHVDGKPRYDGVRDFLRSRGVRAPRGADRRDRRSQAGARRACARP